MSGRIVFGLSAALFGAVILISHGADLWHRLLASAQIAAAIAMMPSSTVRFGSIALGAIYAIWSLACIPGVIAEPAQYVSYGNFFEQFAVVCGAVAVYATTRTRHSRALGRTARVGFALCIISFALAQIVYFSFTAGLVPTWVPPNQTFWAIFTTIAFAFAAVAMLINFYARLAAQMTAMMLAVFGILVWIPHIAARPKALGNWSEFAETYLIAGAALALARVPFRLQWRDRGAVRS